MSFLKYVLQGPQRGLVRLGKQESRIRHPFFQIGGQKLSKNPLGLIVARSHAGQPGAGGLQLFVVLHLPGEVGVRPPAGRQADILPAGTAAEKHTLHRPSPGQNFTAGAESFSFTKAAKAAGSRGSSSSPE